MNITAEELIAIIVATTKSHIDGRDLLDELHPRRMLDIKRRVDGVETWFQADWLSTLRDAIHLASGRPVHPGTVDYLRALPRERPTPHPPKERQET